ncbi:MAG: cytochrome P450 [Planctomycetota bacterium]|nr:cytochrome P450 [Planctomycetota bacterium]
MDPTFLPTSGDGSENRSRHRSKQGEARLPPGPRSSWRPTLQLIQNPRKALETWANEYGDPFLLNALNGPVVVTGREDLLRIIHGQDPSIYAPFATSTIIPLMGSGSMLVLEGEPHRFERRLMIPMFHGDRMKAYGASIQQCAIEQFEAHRIQGSIFTLDLMTAISLEVIVRTIFGGSDREIVRQLMEASRKVVASSSPLLFFSKKTHFSFLGFSPWDQWQKAKTNLFLLLDKVIEQRQQGNNQSDDILSLLCGATYEDGQAITREHIYSELMTFLFAGHETTALSLTWAIYHLHKNTDSLGTLRDELDSMADNSPTSMSAAPYLKATIQETLRIHPIITETLRKLKSPLELGGYFLPAGMGIAPATVLAHHNPNTYSEPESFRPERFIERSYSPFEYMPFGGGHRRCIGAAFASYEMAIVLGTILKRYEVELIDTTPVVPRRRNVTIGPSSGVPIRFVSAR